MNDLLVILLRLAGTGLILLAVLHIPIARQLRWREEVARMTPVNGSIFHVHAFFICLVLVMMGLPCLFDPMIFLERTRSATWITSSYSLFWGIRLYCQWFVYPSSLWKNQRFETVLHYVFTVVWFALFALFGVCAAIQIGWISVNPQQLP